MNHGPAALHFGWRLKSRRSGAAALCVHLAGRRRDRVGAVTGIQPQAPQARLIG